MAMMIDGGEIHDDSLLPDRLMTMMMMMIRLPYVTYGRIHREIHYDSCLFEVVAAVVVVVAAAVVVVVVVVAAAVAADVVVVVVVCCCCCCFIVAGVATCCCGCVSRYVLPELLLIK